MRGSSAAPILFALALTILGVAWIGASPPGAGPDETGQYVKALAAARGDFHGKQPRMTEAKRRAALQTLTHGGQLGGQLQQFLQNVNTPAARWAFATTREFSVPAGLGNPAFGCGLGQPTLSAACLREGHPTTKTTSTDSLYGTYQPFLYLGPGLGTLLSDDAATALRLGRVANAVVSLGLIALAALALWDGSRGALSLTGLVVAVTPSIVSFATALTPSGPEIAAGICLTAALIRLTRERPAPTWVWAAAALGGAVLGCARSLGPPFVLAIVLAVGLLAGRRRVRAAVTGAPRRVVVAAAAAVVLGMAAGLWWEVAYQPSAPFALGEFFRGIGPSIRALRTLAKEGVGVFSALDTPLPTPGFVAWAVLLACLVGAAFVVSGRRDRWLLAALVAGVAVLTVVASAVYRQTGYELQARHVLPVVVVLPLWAGELVHLHGDRLAGRMAPRLLAGTVVVAAAVQALALYAYGRRFAVGTDGSWLFVRHAEWSPPLGWTVWLLLGGIGALAYAAAGWQAARALRTPALA